MTNILTWREDWILRIDTLDEDHRGIVDILSDIARRFGGQPQRRYGPAQESGGDCKSESVDGGSLYEALDRLGAVARRHFLREEEFMRTIDYPLLPAHRSEHALLLAEHTALVRELRERGVDRLDPTELDDLKNWVVAHILGADRGFADHYFRICGWEPGRP